MLKAFKSDSDRKRKMISIRLSDVEYEVLKARYRTYGARNVSDLARLALEHLMADSVAPQQSFAAELADLGRRVLILESQVSLIRSKRSKV